MTEDLEPSALGLQEPVSLRMLSGRWWKVHVDAADVGQAQEHGCGYVVQCLPSERLSEIGFEVVAGPFNTEDDARRESPETYAP